MPGDPSDVVRVFDVDSGDAPGGDAHGGDAPWPPTTSTHSGPDQIDQGQERAPMVVLGRWPWWRRNDPVTRGLTLVGAAGLIVAAVAGSQALRSHPGTQYFINAKLAPVPAVSVDALGCPGGVTCEQTAPPATLVARVLGNVPSGRITYAGQTVDVASTRVYRREIDVSSRQATMRIVSQCVPGSGTVPGQPMILTVRAARVRLTEVIPGAPGCSTLIEGDTTRSSYERGGESLDGILAVVARVPAMMVRP